MPKERLDLLWVPLADHCGGLREEMLAPARKDICGNYDLWDFVNVHTTYPLCGWTRSELAMRVTRAVSRMCIIVRGRFSAGVVLALGNPEWQKGRKPHNSRATSCEGMHPNLE